MLYRLRRDPVLLTAAFAAFISAIFVPPSPRYLSYVDFRVLCLLLSLMLVISGLRKAGTFSYIIRQLLHFAHNTRSLAAVLVGTCFFSSMLITNDVALITFVPLSVMVLAQIKQNKLLIPVIVLQTIAANLGSMLTPLGNPQNLYLYSISELNLLQFLHIMALPTFLSFLLISGSLLLIKCEPVTAPEETITVHGTRPWLILFCLCLLTVVHVLDFRLVLLLVLLSVLYLDRELLQTVDYSLLLTFLFFFIFVGNLQGIPAVSSAITHVINGREMAAGILLSQIISNVPAAMLLSGFTNQIPSLLLGVNIGGLGTLAASMASLISYKQYALTEHAHTPKYIAVFTVANAMFLLLLWPMTAVFGAK